MFYFAADFSGRDFPSEVARALLFLLNVAQTVVLYSILKIKDNEFGGMNDDRY
jgi:hypothetical protein